MTGDGENSKRQHRYRRWLLALPALLIVALLAGLVPVNVGFLKGYVEELVYDKSKLELALEGPVVIRLGPSPLVRTGAITLASEGETDFIRIDGAFARLRLAKLFQAKVHATEARISGAQLDYCALLHPRTKGGGRVLSGLLEADNLEIRDARVFCSRHDDWPQLTLDQVAGSVCPVEPGNAVGSGNIDGLPVELSATLGGIDNIFAKRDFPIDLKIIADTVSVDARGALVGLGRKTAVEFSTVAWTKELGELIEQLVDIELPRLGELNAKAEFRAEGGRVGIVGLDGTLGQSRFDAFDASLVTGGDRPALTLRGAAGVIDTGPFMPEGAGNRSGDVDLSKLVGMLGRIDADAEVAVNRIAGLPLPIGGVNLDATLSDSLLTIDRLDFSSGNTALNASARFDATRDCPALDMSASFADFNTGLFDDVLSVPETLDINADNVSIEASSCGLLLSEHLQSLQATVATNDSVVSLGEAIPPVAIDSASFRVQPGKRSRFSGSGRFKGDQVRLDIAAGSLQELLGTESWPLDADASSAGASAAVRGRAQFTEAGPSLRVNVDLSAERAGALGSFLPIDPESELPVMFAASVSLDDTSLVGRDIEASVGESSVRGNAAWHYSAPQEFVELELHSPILRLERLADAVRKPQGDEPARDTAKREELFVPSVNLDLQIDKVTTRYVDLEALEITGKIRDGLIDDARVNALVEGDLSLTGKLDVDLRQLPATASADVSATNVQVGRLLARAGVADNFNIAADSLELEMSTSGSTPEELLVNVHLSTVLENFEWLVPRDLAGANEEDYYEVQLGYVTLDSAPGERTIAWSRGRVQGVDVGLRLNLPSLDEVFGDEPEFPIRMAAFADHSVMIIEATFDRSAGSESRTHAVLSGAVFDEIPTVDDIVPPLPDYQLSSDVVIGNGRISMPDIEFTAGDSKVAGSFSLNAGERPQVDLALESPLLVIEDLQYFVRQVELLLAATKEVVDIESAGAEDDAEEAAEPSGVVDEAYAIKEGVLPKINRAVAAVKSRADLNVEISIDDLQNRGMSIGSAEVTLNADERALDLSPFRIRLPDGKGGVDLDYGWTETDGFVDMHFRAHASGVSYGGLLRTINPESKTEGVLYLDADLSASARRDPNLGVLSQLLDNANGHIEVGAWPQDVDSSALDLWTANLIFALLPIGGSDSRLNCIVARFEGKDGLMKAKTALMDTTTTVIRARGTLDFATDTVNLLVTPQAKREKLFSASTPVRVNGPIADLSIGVEPIGFFGTLVKWYTFYIYVPFKWLTGERFPEDGTATCYDKMDWELTPEMHEYFLERDFTSPPPEALDD